MTQGVKQEKKVFLGKPVVDDELIKACIHCGMCLPACPTYLETSKEGNSPRGRLYIIKDLLEPGGQSGLLADEALEYLDNCLNCRACETVCPSGVQYGEILDYARTEHGASNYSKGVFAWIRRMVFKYLLPNRNFLRMAFVPAKLFSMLIYPLASIFPALKLQASLLSSNKHKKILEDHYYKSEIKLDISDEDRSLSLPLGCVMDTLYNQVHWDTIKVLNAYGYHVYIPRSTCCGALAHHSGEAEIGENQLAGFLKESSKKPYPIVWNSAGCGSYTKEALAVLDFIEALEQAPYRPEFKDFNNGRRIQAVYHPACHLNIQGISDKYIELLNQIPDLELLPLPEADICCGSAGFYNLIKSEMADAIGERKAGNITRAFNFKERAPAQKSKLVLSANPGCLSQIQAHLTEGHKVLHPISFLAQALS